MLREPEDPSVVHSQALPHRIAALDREGRRSETTAVPVSLSGPKPPPGSVATYETAVQLRKGEEQRLLLYLYDRLSGATKAAKAACTDRACPAARQAAA